MKGFFKFSKDMKYLALYWALGFQEIEEDLFVKNYRGYKVYIHAEEQYVDFGNQITITYVPTRRFELKTHKSFVVLECVDRLLTMGYKPTKIIIKANEQYDISVLNLYIKCFEWGHFEENKILVKNNKLYSIMYTSRLTSGAIERITKITYKNQTYDYGVFDCKRFKLEYSLFNKVDVKASKDFVIKGDSLIKYIGKSKRVIVPNGIKELGPCAFWDNQYVEVVMLPNTLVNLGGDTFYNCSNLKSLTIPSNVERMGNNPFAGCPKLQLINRSHNFILNDGALFNKDMTRLIYYSIIKKKREYKIPKKTRIIGKHAFYLCNRLKKITLNKNLIKLENNPFSGCENLEIINKSNSYHIIDKVIYNKYKNSVIGCLNSINTDYLKLLPIKSISRNSFWNCKGIKYIELPETLEQIGYNPFVGCSNIHFINHSFNYKVVDDVLYQKDMLKLVCYPAWKAVGEIKVNDKTKILERGAFSGCNKMTGIDFNNVEIISKTCFTNCDSLTKVECSNKIDYIGEWAFAHCKNLTVFTVNKLTEIDNNAFSNTSCLIKYKDI